MLTDAHVHLDRYPPAEVPRVLDRARAAGVEWMVTVGMDPPSSEKAVGLAHTHGGVLAAVGVHPWMVPADLPPDAADAIHALATASGVVAIGEVGLDFVENLFLGIDHRPDPSSRQAQEAAFCRQLEIAVDLGLPLNVHCRGAYPQLVAILAEARPARCRGVVHNFDGDPQALRSLLDLGFYVSFGGALTYPGAAALRRVARVVPLDAVLIETDAPYMPLHGDPAPSNEPANVSAIARALARVRKVEDDVVIEASYHNFVTLFEPESMCHVK